MSEQLRFFSTAELRCPEGGVVRLAPDFGERLDALREA